MDTPTPPAAEPTTDREAAGVDLGALAAANLTPVLGRYFERSWSHGEGHRLYDTAGRAYLDLANGIAVSALGHRNLRVTAAVHAQVDCLMGPMAAMGYAEPTVRLAREIAQALPDPIDSVFFLNSGSEAIEAALDILAPTASKKGLELVYAIDEDLPVALVGDAAGALGAAVVLERE